MLVDGKEVVMVLGLGLGLGLLFGSCLILSMSEDASSVVSLLLEALAPERVWAGIVEIGLGLGLGLGLWLDKV